MKLITSKIFLFFVFFGLDFSFDPSKDFKSYECRFLSCQEIERMLKPVFQTSTARFTAVDSSRILFIGNDQVWSEFLALVQEFDRRRAQFKVQIRTNSKIESKTTGFQAKTLSSDASQTSMQIVQAGIPTRIAMSEQEAIEFRDFLLIKERLDSVFMIVLPVGNQVEIRLELNTSLANGQSAVLSQSRLVGLNSWVDLQWDNRDLKTKSSEIGLGELSYSKRRESFQFHRSIFITPID